MIKVISQFEHTIGENVYHFSCAPNSPIGEAKDALFNFVKMIGNIEEQAKANAAAVQVQEKPAESAALPVEDVSAQPQV